MTMVIAILSFLLFTDTAFGICYETDYQLKHNQSKEQHIQTIMDFGDCVRKEHHQQVGKWFCYVSKMVGIQKNDDGTDASGRIRPRPDSEKFFATISEIDKGTKEIACNWGEYGIDNNVGEINSNMCLANYALKISNVTTVWRDSAEYPEFRGVGIGPDFFSLYAGTEKPGTFVWVRQEGENIYVENGQCEKID